MNKSTAEKPAYKRILLKLSGEALQGDPLLRIDPSKLNQLSDDIAMIARLGVQVGIVIGGGNLIRGADFHTTALDRITADQMGMLATVINGLALRDALQHKSVPVKVMSALPITGLVDCYQRHDAIDALEQGKVLIFVAGTGNPLVTTDSAAALRGIEIGADILLKATKVDGVFSADPIKNPNAEHFNQLTYDQVLEKHLGVMDLNAIVLCQASALPVRVFNMNQSDALRQIVCGAAIGTFIRGG